MVVARKIKPEKNFQRLNLPTAFALAVCLLFPFVATNVFAATADENSREPGLLDVWLEVPSLAARPAPYQYMRLNGAQAPLDELRTAILREFDELEWRFEAFGYDVFAKTVNEWRSALQDISSFRTPGNWDPTWLLANPSRVPPSTRVQAIGACLRPEWVEVWDMGGVTRLPWSMAKTLSDLISERSLKSGPEGRVTVVRPNGESFTYGVESWNFHETSLTPGTRIVSGIPLEGDVFIWLRSSLSRLLAHTPSGDDCLEASLVSDAN